MAQGKHIKQGWVKLEGRTDGFYWNNIKVCGCLGEDLHEDFTRVEIIY